jgi:folate-binding protein YgfZ
VLLAPAPQAESLRARLATHATQAGFEVWRWLTIRAGVPVITAATQDAFVAQGVNLDILGGIDFQKGCYTGQEIIARTQYLGRLKERTFGFHAETREVSPGDRIFSSAFEGQPCGTVVNAAPSPGGGCDLLAVVQIAAAERGDARLRASDGPLLISLPLPYAIPVAKAPRGREA